MPGWYFCTRCKGARQGEAQDVPSEFLVRPDPGYLDFIKLCLEHDDSRDFRAFRAGLLLVVKFVGVSKIASETSLSRLTMYRMLSPEGNPRLSSLSCLFRALGIYLWVVDKEFIKARTRLVRPKDELRIPVSIPSRRLGLGHRRKPRLLAHE